MSKLINIELENGQYLATEDWSDRTFMLQLCWRNKDNTKFKFLSNRIEIPRQQRNNLAELIKLPPTDE